MSDAMIDNEKQIVEQIKGDKKYNQQKDTTLLGPLTNEI